MEATCHTYVCSTEETFSGNSEANAEVVDNEKNDCMEFVRKSV